MDVLSAWIMIQPKMFLTPSKYINPDLVDPINDTLLEKEKTGYLVPYMDKQDVITREMREIVVDWLVDVAIEYRMEKQTLFLAVVYVDKFLILSDTPITRATFQLLGVTSLFVAAKVNQVYAPSLDEMIYICDNTYTKREFLDMEKRILDALKWKMLPATAFEMLEIWECVAEETNPQLKLHSEDFRTLVSYFAMLSLLNHDVFTEYLPSQIASSAIYLAMSKILTSFQWTKSLTKYSGQVFGDSCSAKLFQIHNNGEYIDCIERWCTPATLLAKSPSVILKEAKKDAIVISDHRVNKRNSVNFSMHETPPSLVQNKKQKV